MKCSAICLFMYMFNAGKLVIYPTLRQKETVFSFKVAIYNMFCDHFYCMDRKKQVTTFEYDEIHENK